MKQHLLRTEANAEEFTTLFAEARKQGFRVGWLDLEQIVAGESGVPPALDAVASAGAFRAVRVGSERVVAVKRVGGKAVLKDLLREYFSGCHLVVVRGDVDAPDIIPSGSRYTMRSRSGREHGWTARALAQSLGRSRLESK